MNRILDPLPGVSPNSELYTVYAALNAGEVLTVLDAVRICKTVDLRVYISLLRRKYGINIADRWINVGPRKRVKQYWLELPK